MILPRESLFAKEDKSRIALLWKSPRLSYYGADKGLQYGLSGDRVVFVATEKLVFLWETTPLATGSSTWGNPTRPKP